MIETALACIGIVFLIVVVLLMVKYTIKKTRNKIKNIEDNFLSVLLAAAIIYILEKNFRDVYLEYITYSVITLFVAAMFLLFLKKRTSKG